MAARPNFNNSSQHGFYTVMLTFIPSLAALERESLGEAISCHSPSLYLTAESLGTAACMQALPLKRKRLIRCLHGFALLLYKL